MPKVKDIPVGRVSANAAPSVTQSASAGAESFGGGQGRQLQQLGQGIQDAGAAAGSYIIESEQRKSKALVRDSLTNARAEARTFMSDLYTKQGKDAIDAHGVASKTLQDIRKKYAGQFKTPYQKDLFSSNFDSEIESHLDRAISFQERSRLEYEKNTRDAENLEAVDSAVANRTDIRAIGNSEFTIRANTKAQYKGQDATFIKEKEEEAVNLLHKNVLEALSVDSPVAAKQYLKDNWEKFDSASREALKKKIDSDAFEFEVRADAAQMDVDGLTFEQQIEKVNEEKDPEKASALKKEVEERFRLKDKIKERKAKDEEYSYWQQVKKGGEVPFGRVSGDLAKQMVAYKRTAAAGFAETSDLAVLQKLGTMSDEDLKAAPLDDVIKFGRVLTKGDFEPFFDRYLDLRNNKTGGEKGDEKLISIRTDSQLVESTLKSLGIDNTGEKNKDKRKENERLTSELYSKYQDELTAFQQTNDRKPTPQEKRQLLDNLVIEGKVKGFFKKKPVFAIEVKDIPDKDRKQIREALREASLAETEENILATYVAGIKRDSDAK